MTDLQAAVGLRQLEVLDTVLAERRRLADRYSARSAGCRRSGRRTNPTTPFAPGSPIRSGWARGAARGGGADAPLLRDGIATRRGIMAIHLEDAYGDSGADLPHTEAAARDVVLLPLFPGLSEEAQDYVVERLAHYAIAEAA